MELYFLKGHAYRLFTHTELNRPKYTVVSCIFTFGFYDDDLFFGVRTNDITIRVFYRKF